MAPGSQLCLPLPRAASAPWSVQQGEMHTAGAATTRVLIKSLPTQEWLREKAESPKWATRHLRAEAAWLGPITSPNPGVGSSERKN